MRTALFLFLGFAAGVSTAFVAVGVSVGRDLGGQWRQGGRRV